MDRYKRIIKLLQEAAYSESLTDYQFRVLVKVLNFDTPTIEDIKRTQELADKLGWPKAINNATWPRL